MKKIFIGQLPTDFVEQDLSDYFSQFGIIDTISVGVYDYMSLDTLKPWSKVIENFEQIKSHPIVIDSKLVKL